MIVWLMSRMLTLWLAISAQTDAIMASASTQAAIDAETAQRMQSAEVQAVIDSQTQQKINDPTALSQLDAAFKGAAKTAGMTAAEISSGMAKARGETDKASSAIRDMGDALQRAEIVLGTGRTAANQQQRHPFQVGIRYRGDAVGNARPRCHQSHAKLAGQHGMGVGHVDRRAFVTHIDDPHAALGQIIGMRGHAHRA